MTLEEARKKYGELEDFYKHYPESKVYWTSPVNYIGINFISFDKKELYNIFSDFPEKLSDDELRIFAESEHYWADFFSDSLKERGII